MERKPIRKFKRTIKEKKQKYDEKFKKQMDISNFKEKNYILDELQNDLMILDIKESELTKQITTLPKEIQKKLYILAMRNYWKYVSLNTIYKPMYYDYYSYVDRKSHV